jgi:hypothetical protein
LSAAAARAQSLWCATGGRGTVNGMKGASKPKKLGKKKAQKSLKEKRTEKRAAAKNTFGSG